MANALTEQFAVSPTRKVPRLDIDGSSDQICHHYLQGKCTYGDSYRFSHAADAPSNVMAASLVGQAAPTPPDSARFTKVFALNEIALPEFPI